IHSSKLGETRNPIFRIILPEAGARRRPIHFWSVMGDTGANPNLFPREVLPGVWVCPNPDELARTAARRFVDWAWQAIARDGHFHVALSGGKTPQALFRV